MVGIAAVLQSLSVSSYSSHSPCSATRSVCPIILITLTMQCYEVCLKRVHAIYRATLMICLSLLGYEVCLKRLHDSCNLQSHSYDMLQTDSCNLQSHSYDMPIVIGLRGLSQTDSCNLQSHSYDMLLVIGFFTLPLIVPTLSCLVALSRVLDPSCSDSSFSASISLIT